MKEEEFKKYAGRKTFGKNNVCLEGGIVVGYDTKSYNDCLVVKLEEGPWSETACNIKFTDKHEEELYRSGKGLYAWGAIENVIINDPKVLNLCELLKGCEGVKVYSSMIGECLINKIKKDCVCFIQLDGGHETFVDDEGKYDKQGECILFPSKDNRDWTTFKKPLKKGTSVMCSNGDGWYLRVYSCKNRVSMAEGAACDPTLTVKYIVPASEFDFNDFDSNKNKSIV